MADGVCFACDVNDGDKTVKPVKRCPPCGKDFCDSCWRRPGQIKAALKTLRKTFRAMFSEARP